MAVPRRLPPLPNTADLLRMYRIRAQKQLSQNFILQPTILDRFAKAAGEPFGKEGLRGKIVVEVGPGPGGITRSLLARGAKEVHVIEKDERFLPSLRLLQDASRGALKINLGDVLNYNISKLFPTLEKPQWLDRSLPPITLVGNLPFNVSTPLLIRLLKHMETKENIFAYGRVPMLFTFQREVAHRMIAPPGDQERSRLSVVCQNYAQVRYKYTLDGSSFVPPPDVKVGVVSLVPLKQPYIDLPFEFVNRVVTTVMHGKRKEIKKTVGQLFPSGYMRLKLTDQLFAMTDLDRSLKPTALTMDDWEQICFAHKQICEDNPSIRNFVYGFTRDECDHQLLEDSRAQKQRKAEEKKRDSFYEEDEKDEEEEEH